MKMLTIVLAAISGAITCGTDALAGACRERYNTANSVVIDPFCHGGRQLTWPGGYRGSGHGYGGGYPRGGGFVRKVVPQRDMVIYLTPVPRARPAELRYDPVRECAARGGVRGINPHTGRPSCFVPD